MRIALTPDASRPLDPAAAQAALGDLRPLLDELAVDADHDASRLPTSTGAWAASAIDEWDDGDGRINFVQGLLMARALVEHLAPRTIEGDVDVLPDDEAQVISRHGDLRVAGELRLHAMLMVLGDLVVDRRLTDLVRASRLTVIGKLRCKTLRIGSPYWVAGRVDAEAVCFDPGGALWTGAGLHARVVVGSPQSAGVIHGGVSATLHVDARAWNKDPRAAFAQLEHGLVPEALARSSRAHNYFQPEGLLALVEADLPYLRR